MQILLTFAALLASPALSDAVPEAVPEVEWRGRALVLAGPDGRVDRTANLPGDLPPGAEKAIATWLPWMAAEGYSGSLSADGRVLLLRPSPPGSRKSAGGQPPRGRKGNSDPGLERIEETCAAFDRLLPLPKGRSSEPVPPGGQAEPAEPNSAQGDGTVAATWSDDGGPLERETAVVVELATRADQAALLAHLRASFPYLGGFAASDLAGFTLERPLVAAWLAAEPDNEEWRPEAELVHRTAALLCLRRFGQQPFWLSSGVAWYLEMQVLGGVWCFPYRAEFVFAVEHTEWPARLERAFQGRAQRPFSFAEVAHWKRGSFEPEPALASFGVVAWFSDQRPGALSEVLEELRLHRDEHNREDLGGGQWRRIPGWEVPLEAQQAALSRQGGADLPDTLTAAFRRARTAWSPPRRKS